MEILADCLQNLGNLKTFSLSLNGQNLGKNIENVQ